MNRTGCVVSLTNDIAKVQLHDLNCSRCEKGQGCAIRLLPAKPDTNIPTSVQCANAVDVSVGDRVEINFDVSIFNRMRVYSAYLLPLIGLLAGAIAGTMIAGQLSTDSQLLPSLGAIIGFVGGVFVYPSYNCEQHNTDLQGLNPRISRLLKKGEPTIAFQATTSTDG
ncbi:MAG: SoxR reducing system RseC family protein [Granulosicoccaceae bacterium]